MKFKKVFIFIVMSFIFILGVDAASLEFDSKSSLTIKQGETETISIKLKINNDETVEKVEFDLIYNKDLLGIKEIANENGYAQVKNNNTVSVLKVKDNLTDGVIYSIDVTNNSTEDAGEVIEIKNIIINGNAIDEDISKTLTLKKQVTTTARGLNTSAKLTNFSVSNATVKPAFSKDVKEYKIYTNKDSIRQVTIIPKFEESGAVIDNVDCTLGCTSDTTVPNKLTLVMGKNEATFTFKSEDGKNTEIYKFTIYRGDTTDGSNLLSNITIEGVELNEKFDKSNLDYTVTVPYETERLTIKAEAEDENADIQIKGNENLVVGDNVITITVTSAETAEKKIYNITVTRSEFVPSEDTINDTTPVIEKESNKKNIWVIIIIALISTIIIGTAAYFIFFKKNTKKNKKKTDAPEIEVNEKKLEENPIIDEDKEPTSVDEALADLMQTKEIERTKEMGLN